jgi:hypothetical protein
LDQTIAALQLLGAEGQSGVLWYAADQVLKQHRAQPDPTAPEHSETALKREFDLFESRFRIV